MPDLFSDNQEPAHQHNFSSTGINQKTIMRLPTSSHRWRSLLSSLLLLWNAKCFTSAQADTSKNPPKDPIRVVGRKIKVTDANGQLLTVDIPDNIWNIAKDDKKKLIDKTIQWQFVDTQGTQDAPPPVNDDYLRVMRVKKPWTDTERRQVERMALTRFYEAVGASALIDSRAPYCSWQGIRCFEPPGSERDYLMHAIDLSFQRLSGTLPTELVLMLDLKFLNVTGNRLQGSLPTEYLHMSKLQEVRLARNQFTSLPLASTDDMQKPLAPLKVLDAASNPLSEFSLPKKWHPAWTGLVHLDLSNTFVNGSLFVDSLPPNLEALWLGHNVLTGTLPRDLGKLFRLHTLDLGSNALTGTLPKSGLPSFETLILAQNAFAGPVEEFIRQLQSSSPNLMSLQLKNNSLTGSLPQDGWSGLKQLGTLTLSQNSINGSIPTDFYLNVQSNLR